MDVKENVDLFPFNTFGIHARARHFLQVTSHEEITDLFRTSFFKTTKRLILGGGSNVLFTGDFNGLVVRNQITGIETVAEDENFTSLRVGSGEGWHPLVRYCVSADLGGIENLSLIPGTVGAAPMQNIGAYGVEVKQVIDHVEAIEIATGAVRTFSREECAFGYRDSVFKQAARGQYFISSVTLSLTRKNHHINTSYGVITDVLNARGITTPSIRDVSDAVIAIRSSKLPDPAQIGNAGSFFKNPTIPHAAYDRLRARYPGMPAFAQGTAGESTTELQYKVPAAWLIEQCGWKGKTFGNIGVHKHQALVLVNYGGGEGRQVLELAMEIQSSVRDKFDIDLHPEVNIIGGDA